MPSSDGVLDVPGVVSFEGDTKMAEIDATIKQAMDQDFAAGQAALRQGFGAGAVRRNDGANFVTEAGQNQHLLAQQLIGAKAAGQLDRDALSKGILDARSAAGQPGNAPDASK